MVVSRSLFFDIYNADNFVLYSLMFSCITCAVYTQKNRLDSSFKLYNICLTTLEQFEKVSNLWAVLCAYHLLDGGNCTLHAFRFNFASFYWKKRVIHWFWTLHCISVGNLKFFTERIKTRNWIDLRAPIVLKDPSGGSFWTD